MALYRMPAIVGESRFRKYSEKYEKHNYKMEGDFPLIPLFGSHYVDDTYEVVFDFHMFGQNRLLFSDMDGYNIT